MCERVAEPLAIDVAQPDPASLTQAELNHAVHVMEVRGGGFAKLIAAAYCHADSVNRARLTGAFDELFRSYAGQSFKQEAWAS